MEPMLLDGTSQKTKPTTVVFVFAKGFSRGKVVFDHLRAHAVRRDQELRRESKNGVLHVVNRVLKDRKANFAVKGNRSLLQIGRPVLILAEGTCYGASIHPGLLADPAWKPNSGSVVATILLGTGDPSDLAQWIYDETCRRVAQTTQLPAAFDRMAVGACS